jgi:hypothetical protein
MCLSIGYDIEANERAYTSERIAEHVASRRELAAEVEIVPRPAVSNLDFVGVSVWATRIKLVVEVAVRGVENAAELRLPAETRHPAPRADTVADLAPIAAPVAEHVAFVPQAVLIDAVHIPTVLPLADLDCQREISP